MSGIGDEIEEARLKVAYYRLKAERPGSRIEDDLALERARNRLLTLELRASGGARARMPTARSKKTDTHGRIRTKHKHLRVDAKTRAETAFQAIQAGAPAEKKGRILEPIDT